MLQYEVAMGSRMVQKANKLVPIIFTCIVWGSYLSKYHINFQCYNANLVIAINKSLSKDKFTLCSLLLHILTFVSLLLTYLG